MSSAFGAKSVKEEFDDCLAFVDGTIDINVQGRRLDDESVERWCTWANNSLPAFLRRYGVRRRSDGFVAAREVNFSSNLLGDTGIAAVLRALYALRVGARVLKLSRNCMGRAAAAALMDWMVQTPMALLELHLSYNCIPREGALCVLRALALNPAYPAEGGVVPLWLRLDNNVVDEPEELISTAEQQMRLILGSISGDTRCSTCPILCFQQEVGMSGCTVTSCALSTSSSCPLAQVTYFSSQRRGIPPEAMAWNYGVDPRQEEHRWRMTAVSKVSLISDATRSFASHPMDFKKAGREGPVGVAPPPSSPPVLYDGLLSRGASLRIAAVQKHVKAPPAAKDAPSEKAAQPKLSTPAGALAGLAPTACAANGVLARAMREPLIKASAGKDSTPFANLKGSHSAAVSETRSSHVEDPPAVGSTSLPGLFVEAGWKPQILQRNAPLPAAAASAPHSLPLSTSADGGTNVSSIGEESVKVDTKNIESSKPDSNLNLGRSWLDERAHAPMELPGSTKIVASSLGGWEFKAPRTTLSANAPAFAPTFVPMGGASGFIAPDGADAAAGDPFRMERPLGMPHQGALTLSLVARKDVEVAAVSAIGSKIAALHKAELDLDGSHSLEALREEILRQRAMIQELRAEVIRQYGRDVTAK